MGEKIQEKNCLLMADLDKYMKTPSEEDKLKIKESIKAAKKEIKDQATGTNLMDHLLVRVELLEENLSDFDELRKLTKELDDVRKSTSFSAVFRSFCKGFVEDVWGAFTSRSLVKMLTKLKGPSGLGIAASTAVASAAKTAIEYMASSKEEEQGNKNKSKASWQNPVSGLMKTYSIYHSLTDTRKLKFLH